MVRGKRTVFKACRDDAQRCLGNAFESARRATLRYAGVTVPQGQAAIGEIPVTNGASSSAPGQEDLAAIITAAPVTAIDDVIRVMQGLDAALEAGDGLKWFNLLYLRVTEAVQAAEAGGAWLNRAWLARLDVVFAGYYFNAVVQSERSPAQVARAWQPLLEARRRPGLAPIQFALAGMNAHINHDLPLAVVETCRETGVEPAAGSPEHSDFDQVNGILEAVEAQVKQTFATGIVGEVDRDLRPVDDLVAMWSVRKARETAWANALVLWRLRAEPELAQAFEQSLDRLVALSSQGLLTVVG